MANQIWKGFSTDGDFQFSKVTVGSWKLSRSTKWEALLTSAQLCLFDLPTQMCSSKMVPSLFFQDQINRVEPSWQVLSVQRLRAPFWSTPEGLCLSGLLGAEKKDHAIWEVKGCWVVEPQSDGAFLSPGFTACIWVLQEFSDLIWSLPRVQIPLLCQRDITV